MARFINDDLGFDVQSALRNDAVTKDDVEAMRVVQSFLQTIRTIRFLNERFVLFLNLRVATTRKSERTNACDCCARLRVVEEWMQAVCGQYK